MPRTTNAPPPDNGMIAIKGYGEYRVIITEINHGMSIVATDSKSRHGNAFYPTKRTSGSFDIALLFLSHEDRHRFCNWVVWYLRHKADPDASARYGEMAVICPKFNFFKTGLPDTPLPYGDSVGRITYPVRMSFIGTNDPLDPQQNPYVVSQFIPSTNPENDPALPYFTPGDKQLAGDAYGKDLYDGPSATELMRRWGSYRPADRQESLRTWWRP